MTQQPYGPPQPQPGYGPPPQGIYQAPYGQPPQQPQAPWGPPQQPVPAGPQQAPAPTQDEILASGRGDTNAPDGSGAFAQIGSSIVGRIVSTFPAIVTDPGKAGNPPKPDKNGKLQPQLNVTLQTGYRGWAGCPKFPTQGQGADKQPRDPATDDGKRRIFAKYRLLNAFGIALQNTFGTTQGLELDGMWVKWTHTADIPTGQINPLQDFSCKVWPSSDQPPAEILAELQAQSQAPPLPLPGGHTLQAPQTQQWPQQPAQQAAGGQQVQQQQAPWGPPPQPAAQNPWPPQQTQGNPFGGQPDQPPF